MKVIECSGDPRQIGRQTGEALRDEIREHLALYPPPSGPEWERRLPAFVETTAAHLPEALEEMQGLAEGAHVPVEAIYGLNFDLYPDDLAVGAGCTNVVFLAGPDGPLWGKNNDGQAPGKQRPVCARIVRPRTGLPLVTFPFAGYVAIADGMNAEGLAIGHSSVGSVFQQSDRHVQILPWSCHALQHSRTTAEFVRRMASVPLRGKGYSYVVVDREGRACSIEAPCPLVQVRQPASPRGIFCVNCYQFPALAEADRRTPAGKAHALARHRFLDTVLAADGPRDVACLQALLQHHGSPGLCRHGEDDGLHTEYAMLGIPRQNRVLFCPGYPCRTPYRQITL